MANALRTLPDAPQALSASEVLAHLGVSVSKGLADEEVRHRLNVFGSNTVVSTRKPSGLIILLHQFQSPVVYLLIAAAALAFYTNPPSV
jgi:P-type Ca2+ transporter type 2C